MALVIPRINPKGIGAFSPGLARQCLPWVSVLRVFINPEGVVSSAGAGATPSGLIVYWTISQGSLASSATLG